MMSYTPYPLARSTALSNLPTDSKVHLSHWLQEQALQFTHGVFCVEALGSVGYLHLSAGRVVHAQAEACEGEEAALKILTWEHGSVRSTPRSVQELPSIEAELDALLLKGAKRLEEMLYSESTGPNSSTQRTGVRAVTGARQAVPPPLPVVEPAPVLADILLTTEGQLIQQRGRGEELSARVAYANRLGRLIGVGLGSGAPQAIELISRQSKTISCVIRSELYAASWTQREGHDAPV